MKTDTLVELIMAPQYRGENAAIVNGRALDDAEVDGEGNLRPLLTVVAEKLVDTHVVFSFSRLSGLVVLPELTGGLKEATEKYRNDLTTGTCPRQSQDPELDQMIGVLDRLATWARQGRSIPGNGKGTLAPLLVISPADNLFPTADHGHRSPAQLRAMEAITQFARSLSVRRSGFYVLLGESRSGRLDPLLQEKLSTVRIPNPDEEAMSTLVQALQQRYPDVQLADGVSVKEVAVNAARAETRSIDGLFYAASRNGKTVHLKQIAERKRDDIRISSDGTLLPLDKEKYAGIHLEGRTIAVARRVLRSVAEGLRRGDPMTLKAVCQCGPRSVGKSNLAIEAAIQADVNVSEAVTPKDQYVGRSEARLRRMLDTWRETGGVALIDEIDKTWPISANNVGGDSGVSSHIRGALQSWLADNSMNGRCALFSTTNDPELGFDPIIRSRFHFVPVLAPFKDDMTAIVNALVSRQLGLQPCSHDALVAAGEAFFEKGNSPREIREAVIAQRNLLGPEASSDLILARTAKEIMPSADRAEVELGDLLAIRFSSLSTYMPWYDERTGGNDMELELPEHIVAILDQERNVDMGRLEQRIAHLRRQQN